MNKRYSIILSVLANNQDALTTSFIFYEIQKIDATLFEDTNDLAKCLNVLKSKKQHVENGISEIIDGKTKLTWKITDAGRKALNDDNTIEHSTLESTITSNEITEIDDPIAFIASSKDAILALVEKLIEAQKQPVIEHKDQKIALLKKCHGFVEQFSPAEARFLTGVITDLERI